MEMIFQCRCRQQQHGSQFGGDLSYRAKTKGIVLYAVGLYPMDNTESDVSM